MNQFRKLSQTKWYFLFLLLVTSYSLEAPAQHPISKEYQIKAVFLFNFTQFVQWRPEAFQTADSPLIIGVLGNDPFGSFLDQIVKGESIGNHKLVVERYQTLTDIRQCHILFISLDEKQGLRKALEKVADQPILTVSDTEGFTKEGGMIRFYPEAGRIRLRINTEPVSQAGLVISSKLLSLAEVVPSKND